MMTVQEVRISGETESGRSFEGRMVFAGGLQIVSAPNGYGKSMAAAGIAWCLGLEAMYGLQPGDTSLFPEAARERLDLGTARGIGIKSSSADVVLMRDDGARVRLSRSIRGGRAEVIQWDDGKERGNVVVGWGSMKDPTAGFQSRFFSWAGLPPAKLMNTQGREVPLYLENLAPLFFVEQMEGWSDIQAQQVYRYGISEVAEGAVEYLLGLEAELRARLMRQAGATWEAARREEARTLAKEFEEAIQAAGWVGEMSTRKSLDDLVHQWSAINLLAIVKELFRFDYGAEQKRRRATLEALRNELTRGNLDPHSTVASTEASQHALALKRQRHDIQTELRTIRAQLDEQRSLLGGIESREKSAKDLLRLKKEGIGILPRAECPTCHQTVDPENLHLVAHGVETIEAHIESVRRERELLMRSVRRLEGEAIELGAKAARIEEEFGKAEEALALVQQAVGPVREAMVKLTTDILALEREIDRNDQVHTRLLDLERRMREWSEVTLKGPVAVEEALSATSEIRLAAFADGLRQNLIALGHSGVHKAEAGDVRLDERYVPYLGHRRLRALGSASDRARLVMAYVLALLEAGAHHPGFVLLDEPIQQNPDEMHHEKLVNFLNGRGRAATRQVIVLTSLRTQDVEALKRGGQKVHRLKGKFLREVQAN